MNLFFVPSIAAADGYKAENLKSVTQNRSFQTPIAARRTILSEIVQYWTAIYPELADHKKVQSTRKPILPRGCDHLTKTSMRNKTGGKSKNKQIEGAVKDKAGELINDPDLEATGEAECPDGKIQKKEDGQNYF
jgi:uncharacterized protein YjbJ (UPF0337 family)